MRRVRALLLRQRGEKKKQEEATEKHAPILVKLVSSNNEALLVKGSHAMGVSLACLLALKVPPGAEFKQVRDIIMDITRDTPGNRSYFAHISQNPETSHHVGKADYFVSYAWKGDFDATMKALSKHFEGQSGVKIWIDIAMVDQHAAATMDLNFGALSRTFQGSLKEIGKAVIVLTPAQNPIAITRSWCCFEWASIKQAGIPFEYCVTPEDVEGLIDFMERGMGFQNFNKLFAGINVEKATAFKKSDEQAILQLMREIGLKEVNDIIMFSLKDWLLRVATEAEKRVKRGTKEGVNLLNAKGSLHQALGEYDDALPLFRQALDMARQVQPENVVLVAEQLNNLAALLGDQGKFEEALGLTEEALQLQERALGKDHPSTITSRSWIGGLLESQRKYDDALPMMRSVLEARKRVLGEDHPDVDTALNNLALLLKNKGDLKGAEPLFQEALAIRKKALGEDHPDVAQSLNNLALLLYAKGDLKGAEQLFRESLAIRKKALGDDHPDVAQSLNNLALVLQEKGDLKGAEQLYREALAIRKKALGDDHPDVALSLNNLAFLLRDTNRKEEARELGCKAYEIALHALGHKHPSTANYKNWLTL